MRFSLFFLHLIPPSRGLRHRRSLTRLSVRRRGKKSFRGVAQRFWMVPKMTMANARTTGTGTPEYTGGVTQFRARATRVARRDINERYVHGSIHVALLAKLGDRAACILTSVSPADSRISSRRVSPHARLHLTGIFSSVSDKSETGENPRGETASRKRTH